MGSVSEVNMRRTVTSYIIVTATIIRIIFYKSSS